MDESYSLQRPKSPKPDYQDSLHRSRKKADRRNGVAPSWNPTCDSLRSPIIPAAAQIQRACQKQCAVMLSAYCRKTNTESIIKLVV
jgi:hypothetical protein